MTEQASYTGPQRIFSGIQPTGNLHLGNYLGALKKFADLQVLSVKSPGSPMILNKAMPPMSKGSSGTWLEQRTRAASSALIRLDGNLDINSMSDADFGGLYKTDSPEDKSSAQSRIGYLIRLGNCMLVWKS